MYKFTDDKYYRFMANYKNSFSDKINEILTQNDLIYHIII